MKKKLTNKKVGNDFEQEASDILYNGGFWVHNFANNKNGQPADIIACRGDETYLIDAKDCANDYFSISRIEDNQHLAMTLWMHRTNTVPLFVIKFVKSGEIYVINYLLLTSLGEHHDRITEEEIAEYGERLVEWL